VRNEFIESFNSKLRDKCLKGHVFLNLGEAREIVVAWGHDCNRVRPHGVLGENAAQQFASAWQTVAAATAFSDGLREGLS